MAAREAKRLERSSLHGLDLLSEALAGVLQRPGRSILTMLGTILGIGAFVSILGLTATASGQIDQRFNVLSATEVTVNDVGPQDPQELATAPVSFPADADQRIDRLNGVNSAGTWWTIPLRNPIIAAAPDSQSADAGDGSGLSLLAATPGIFAVIHPTVSAGVLFNAFHQQRAEHVAVLGISAARRLGITRLDAQPAVFVNGTPYTVTGIISNAARNPEILLSVVIPSSTALAAYGPPTDQRAAMLIDTKLGAAPLIARQAPLALRPDAPQLFQTVPPPDPRSLREGVASDLNSLFLLLAAICLIIGAVGIANTTLVAVLERTAEIGLRRSLGARPRHIAWQFLTESTALGSLGGLIGTSLGVAIVLLTALAHQWTAILQPWAVLPAPLIGSLIGLAAGLYPSLRAASIEPVEALRR